MSLWRLLQMTLADYSLSDVVFDSMDHWKNVLAEAAASNNNNNSSTTKSLTELVQLLEEFIHIARSELAALSWSARVSAGLVPLLV